MPIPKIKTQYEYEKYDHPRVDFNPSDKNSKSKAIQSDMDAADINKIMARFEKTGVFIDPSGVERQPQYGDFTVIRDYHTTLSALKHAESAFNAYPAKLRNRFDNDLQKFIDFMEDSKNDLEAVELGLKDPSTLPIKPIWDSNKNKWTNPKDGSVLETQLAAPLNTGSATGQA